MPRPGPSPLHDVRARQRVLDASADLQSHRSAIAARLEAGQEVPGAQVYASGTGINTRMMAEARTWSHLLSVRPKTTLTQLRASLPNNRVCIAAGTTMLSALDVDGTTAGARRLLAAERDGAYYLCQAPVQMKVVEMRTVLLQGPFSGDEPSVMSVTAPAVLRSAVQYWHAVMATAVPAREVDRGSGAFTSRQATIVELMRHDLTDQGIADALGVSVRTVRSDIAVVMQAVGAGSRFSAGVQLADELLAD